MESEPGMGSKFYFTVELSKTAQQEPTEPRNSCLPVHKKGLKILLAEDDKVNGIVISRILKEAGQNVTHVADGAEVIRQLEKEKYDLILMDIQMPDMDGLEAVRAIREIEKETHEHIPIIAVTAHALKGDREKYLSQGMDEYVSKPLQIDDLLNKISRLIESLAEREETDGMKIAVHTNSDEPPVCKQKSKASVLEEISGNVDLLGKALDEKNFQLVEKYAHDVKLLSEESNMTGLRSIAFRMELAARKEDFHAANRHHTDMMDILKKLKEAGNNENTDRGR